MNPPDQDWQANGWEDHDRFRLEVARRMTFRAKLQWLEDAHALLRRLEQTRPWIDQSGVIHEPTGKKDPGA
jgi:hypothetical protein